MSKPNAHRIRFFFNRHFSFSTLDRDRNSSVSSPEPTTFVGSRNRTWPPSGVGSTIGLAPPAAGWGRIAAEPAGENGVCGPAPTVLGTAAAPPAAPGGNMASAPPSVPGCGPVIGNLAPPRGVSPRMDTVPAPGGNGDEKGISGRRGAVGMRRSTSLAAGFGAVGITGLDGTAGVVGAAGTAGGPAQAAGPGGGRNGC